MSPCNALILAINGKLDDDIGGVLRDPTPDNIADIELGAEWCRCTTFYFGARGAKAKGVQMFTKRQKMTICQ